MTRYAKRGWLVLIVALSGAQLVPVDRSNPPVEADVAAPPEVKALLRQACYDCHSHETVWPGYSRVAPVSWVLANHVREARGELNFSAWARYDAAQLAHKLEEVAEVMADGTMPLWSYRLVHRRAVLTGEQRATIRRWAESGAGEAAP